jgi:hypothetical protein
MWQLGLWIPACGRHIFGLVTLQTPQKEKEEMPSPDWLKKRDKHSHMSHMSAL